MGNNRLIRYGVLSVLLVFVLGSLLAGCAPAAGPVATPQQPAATSKPAASQPPSSTAAPANPTPPPPTVAKKPDKVIIAKGLSGASEMPLWVAKDMGFFAQNGIDAEIVTVEGGAVAVQALAGGKADFAHTGPALVNAALQGSDVVYVAGFLLKPPYALMVPPAITKPQDLKGKSIGINQVGGMSYDTTVRVIRSWGMDPAKDVTLVPAGSQANRVAALKGGTVASALVERPYDLVLEKDGFKRLVDFAGTDLLYLGGNLGTTRSFIAKNEDITRRVVKSWIEAIHAFKTRKDEVVKLFDTRLAGTKHEDNEAAWQFYVTDMLGGSAPFLSDIPIKAVTNVLEDLAHDIPEAAKANPESLLDLRFVKEFAASGYINKLYGR